MGGKTHMAFGAFSFALLAGPVNQTLGIGPETPALMAPIGLAVGSVAGLLPDIDEPNALLGRGGWMPKAMGPLLRALAMVISLPFRLIGMVLKGTLGHRGGTHSLAMSFIFTLAFAIPITMFLGQGADWLIWTIWMGFISHLIADMLNPSGVPLLWPLFSKHKTYHLLPKPLRIPTESPANFREQTVKAGITAGTGVLLAFYLLLPAGLSVLA